MNFPIKTCPICQQTLKLNYSGTTSGYVCPMMASYRDGLCSDLIQYQSHYSVMFDSTTTQRIILPPYLIITEASTNKTKVYRWLDSAYSIEPTELIMELPSLDAQDPTKLLNRLKLLIPFS